MIPLTQLEALKPIQDQTNRINQVKSKRSVSFKKGRLTKRARQWAWFGAGNNPLIKHDKYKGPQGQRSYGNLPMEKRK